jgi:hypothetical protein
MHSTYLHIVPHALLASALVLACTGRETAESNGSTGPSTSDTSTTGPATGLVLDPASLNFFELPIGSVRYAVAGFDPAQQTCVSVIFFGDIETEVCDAFEVGDNAGFPYVFITPDATPPCMDWDYAGNVTLDAASGCVRLTSHDPLTIALDMTLAVSGEPFTGTITVASP